METKKKSSAAFPGVGFQQAALRVVLSGGGDFGNEDERQAAQHYAIMAMHPDDVDRAGWGPGTIIADLEQFDDAEKFATLFAAGRDMLQALQIAENAIRGVLLYEAPGSAKHQEYAWVLKTIHDCLNKAHGKAN